MDKKNHAMPAEATLDTDLMARIRDIWEASRQQAIRSVNSAHVCANWLIGKQIVEAEQGGEQRATYGKALLKSLSQQLTDEYGSGFSVSALQYMRAFFLAYPTLLEIQHAARVISPVVMTAAHESDWQPGKLHSGLSWTHYRILLKIERQEARQFYEIETIRNGWSARQLERQISSLLFDRLLKSRDKEGVMQLANQGLLANRPIDVIKDPYVLEFLDLPEASQWQESQLEQALLSQLQDFLLELGSGFAFVGRQVRLTLDGDHFYPDMVFYHVKLKCYVVIDLKLGKLNHADLGQMQLYVNYYDHDIANADDNPTIGLILCSEKNDAVVRYVLGDHNQQIFASRYQLHLPTEEQLQQELRRELDKLALPKPPLK
ncbi:PDDEXK nuclease domain-containing protein [Thiothrix lacustris]|uniref:PDDEXK nuclease domain-containing protein n=1 Tax=Thiothrix lacustris TaxID=525917 RepID=A0ABY9MQW6_9GAMM|nr:PDDEXK nuclease domain-containing protein [Thiothrix lacustris]WML91043.1 PDDEXK nuclease domain-containing protein [Thiothrix lacustris]